MEKPRSSAPWVLSHGHLERADFPDSPLQSAAHVLSKPSSTEAGCRVEQLASCSDKRTPLDIISAPSHVTCRNICFRGRDPRTENGKMLASKTVLAIVSFCVCWFQQPVFFMSLKTRAVWVHVKAAAARKKRVTNAGSSVHGGIFLKR